VQWRNGVQITLFSVISFIFILQLCVVTYQWSNIQGAHSWVVRLASPPVFSICSLCRVSKSSKCMLCVRFEVEVEVASVMLYPLFQLSSIISSCCCPIPHFHPRCISFRSCAYTPWGWHQTHIYPLFEYIVLYDETCIYRRWTLGIYGRHVSTARCCTCLYF
jgi:hypothetical protein